MNYNIFMIKIKEPSVADIFYTSDKEKLNIQLDGFKAENQYEYASRAVIVPHAGYFYSGKLAYQGINQLNKNIKNIFIIAPSHKEAFEGIALTGFDEWKTPLGNIKINQDINLELINNFKAQIYDKAYEKEHSVEIQVPIIQKIFSDVQIIPVLYCMEKPQTIKEILKKYYPNPDFGFIISTDLSHFLENKEAQKIDLKTADMIESGNIKGFQYEQACGAIGIVGLSLFCEENNYSLIRIGLYNSSLMSGDKSRVVGYGSWMLFEGNKNQFLKKYYSSYILKLCKDIISSRFEKKEIEINCPKIFDEKGAVFVTLKKENNLRGCIGSIIAHRSIFDDIKAHSINSAFFDNRFNPLTEDELDKITIYVSLLSDPKAIDFSDENDLLNKIIPFKDGIIIKDKNKQAVYLPSVWEELPDKEIFLKSLKIKAGMNPDYFSDTFEAYRFEAEYIS